MPASWLPERKGIKNRNDASALHEVMEEAQLSPADLLARELIQNSKDAAEASFLKEDAEHKFRMEFEFRDYEGADLEKIREEFQLKTLNTHVQSAEAHGLRSLTSKKIDLGSCPELRVLIASDFGASGLGGRIEDEDDSAYFRAMLTLGVKRKDTKLAGGSKGFGKSAFIKGSHVGTVLSYTKSHSLDGEETYSMGGVSYQDAYEKPGSKNKKDRYGGLASFGNKNDDQEGLLNPVFGEEAIRLAELLGLPTRTEDDINSFGTSLVLLFPKVKAKELLSAVERNWWPALATETLEVEIHDRTTIPNVDLYPDPAHNPELANYAAIYKLVVGHRKEPTATEDQFQLEAVQDQKLLDLMVERFETPASKKKLELGKLGVRYNEQLASPSEQQLADPNFELASRVALIRSTGMVIQEMRIAQKKEPVVYGAFVCDLDIEPLLRELEPAAHNYWWSNEEHQKRFLRSTNPEVADVTEAIERRIKSHTRSFKAKWGVSDEVKTRRNRLLGRAFGSIFKSSTGPGGDGPGGTTAPIQIREMVADEITSSSADLLRQRISFRARLAPKANFDDLLCEVECRVVQIESGHEKGDVIEIEWTSIPESFQVEPSSGRALGRLTKMESLQFVAETLDYQSSTIQIVPTITPVSQPGKPIEVSDD